MKVVSNRCPASKGIYDSSITNSFGCFFAPSRLCGYILHYSRKPAFEGYSGICHKGSKALRDTKNTICGLFFPRFTSGPSLYLYLLLILVGVSSSLVAQTTVHDLYISALAKDSARDFNGALEDLEKAIAIKENDSVHVLHARVETETNNIKEAYDEVNEVIKHNHNYFDAYMLRGILRARQGNYEGAVHDFNKCVKLDPNSAKAYYNRGLAHAYLDEVKQGIKDFTKATELDPKYAIAWFQRGYWKEVSGDYQGSLADLTKAKELNPNDKNLHVSLAVTNYKLNNKEAACNHLAEAKNMGATGAEDLILMMCK